MDGKMGKRGDEIKWVEKKMKIRLGKREIKLDIQSLFLVNCYIFDGIFYFP